MTADVQPSERILVTDELAEVLSEFARTMVTDFPIQGILDHLVQRIVDILPITAAGVTLIAPGTDPRYIAASNPAALEFEKLQTELDQGPCLAAYQSGEAVSVPDLRIEDRFPEFTPRAREAGMAAVFAFPLSHGDAKPLGALDIYRDTAGDLSPEVMSAAQTLADVAAAYLLNAQARADLQASSDQSREAALHDALTGLPNRVLLLERIGHAALRSSRSGKPSALLFVDLDRFKDVNDTYGHQVGDELLVAIAARLPGVLRPADTVSRISGDEFVVLCEDLDEPSEADALVERINSAFAVPFALKEVELRLTASVGVAFTGAEGATPEELIRDADLAMYKSKRREGAGAFAVDTGALHRANNPADLEDDLRGAAGRGELCLEYQPIVNASDGRIQSVEALLRWRHPVHGLISPAVLIPLAERTGLIVEIGRWVLDHSQAERRGWTSPLGDALGLAVNVSPSQLLSAGFTASVASALQGAATDPALLTLEITESVFERDPDRALIVLNELRALGVKLALDDFGTGYSSLSLLKRYPVDCLKIDREFVADLGQDPTSRAIVSAVLSLGHAMGMQVVGEGVETAEQRAELSELRCDLCQGFYFAHPMSASKLGVLLRRGARAASSARGASVL